MAGGNYNTTGVLKGPSGASGARADEASPEIVVTAAEISKLDALQMLLDVVGLIPGLGAPADILNAIISGARGDWLGAALSLFGAVPVADRIDRVTSLARSLQPACIKRRQETRAGAAVSARAHRAERCRPRGGFTGRARAPAVLRAG
jgi:hypothetical protein